MTLEEVMNLFNRAILLRKGVVIGKYHKGQKKVHNEVIRADKVSGYVPAFKALYGENFVNKAFPEISVFAIKIDDGKLYTDNDVVFNKPKAKKVAIVEEEDNGI